MLVCLQENAMRMKSSEAPLEPEIGHPCRKDGKETVIYDEREYEYEYEY